jgi:hypothetical protein
MGVLFPIGVFGVVGGCRVFGNTLNFPLNLRISRPAKPLLLLIKDAAGCFMLVHTPAILQPFSARDGFIAPLAVPDQTLIQVLTVMPA